jgi:uncharacterized protein YutE (UPF0331/DUF86 family)
MVMEAEKSELDILRTLRNRYEQRGYTFVAHPTGDLVPEFLRGFRPDALALSERESVVIEIKSRRSSDGPKGLAQIAERVSKQPNWKFEVYYAGDFPQPTYERPDDAEIAELLDEIKKLLESGFVRAAFVMAWGALEAITRALQSDKQGGSAPMLPSEIVEWLSSTGHVDSATGRLLRSTINMRNAVVHGDQAIDPEESELRIVYSTLRSLAEELKTKQTA